MYVGSFITLTLPHKPYNSKRYPTPQYNSNRYPNPQSNSNTYPKIKGKSVGKVRVRIRLWGGVG